MLNLFNLFSETNRLFFAQPSEWVAFHGNLRVVISQELQDLVQLRDGDHFGATSRFSTFKITR